MTLNNSPTKNGATLFYYQQWPGKQFWVTRTQTCARTVVIRTGLKYGIQESWTRSTNSVRICWCWYYGPASFVPICGSDIFIPTLQDHSLWSEKSIAVWFFVARNLFSNLTNFETDYFFGKFLSEFLSVYIFKIVNCVYGIRWVLRN